MIRSRIRRAGFLAATGLFLVATTRPGTAAEMASVALPWGDAVASAIQGLGSVLVPLAMTAAMAQLAADPSLVASLGASARVFAESFTWERAAAETDRHLQRVVAARSVA